LPLRQAVIIEGVPCLSKSNGGTFPRLLKLGSRPKQPLDLNELLIENSTFAVRIAGESMTGVGLPRQHRRGRPGTHVGRRFHPAGAAGRRIRDQALPPEGIDPRLGVAGVWLPRGRLRL
jgi:hypothetical protein